MPENLKPPKGGSGTAPPAAERERPRWSGGRGEPFMIVLRSAAAIASEDYRGRVLAQIQRVLKEAGRPVPPVVVLRPDDFLEIP